MVRSTFGVAHRRAGMPLTCGFALGGRASGRFEAERAPRSEAIPVVRRGFTGARISAGQRPFPACRIVLWGRAFSMAVHFRRSGLFWGGGVVAESPCVATIVSVWRSSWYALSSNGFG